MSAGITVQIDGGETERVIHRLTASMVLANTETALLIAEQLEAGKVIARRNIEHLVYARPQGPNTRYKRTYDLLNSVRAGTIGRAGAITGGQVYITRNMPNFKRVYYPVFVEHGFDAGAHYEGRAYWAATTAELHAVIPAKVATMGRKVARKMV